MSKEYIWSDIDADFKLDSTGSIAIRPDVEAVMESIGNILGTRKGERLFLPQFGSNLMDALFEPLDDITLTEISHELKDAIEMWDDRVDILHVSFERRADNNELSVVLEFRIKGFDEVYTFKKAIV